jgi:hypothetical protein
MRVGGIVLALAMAGCSSGTGTLKDDVCFMGGAPDCGSPCPSFDESAAEVRAERCEYVRTAEIGTCGEYRYTSYSTGFSSDTKWFDASGKVVAVVAATS